MMDATVRRRRQTGPRSAATEAAHLAPPPLQGAALAAAPSAGGPASQTAEVRSEAAAAATLTTSAASAADVQRAHARAAAKAFELSCTQRWAASDAPASCVYCLLLLLLGPAHLKEIESAKQLAAIAIQFCLLAAPGLLSCAARRWYLPHRSAITAACLAISWLLFSVALPPPAPLSVGPASQHWPGWLGFIALLRALGLNFMSWTLPMPFKLWLVVHMVGVVESMRLAVTQVCFFSGLTTCAAQHSFAHATRLANSAARVLTPIALLPPATPAVPAMGAEACPCACARWALFILATVGCGLPITWQYLAHASAKRSFFRRYCPQPSCQVCAVDKGRDIAMLSATACLLFPLFCAVCWQLVGELVHGSTLLMPLCARGTTVVRQQQGAVAC